MFFPFFVVPVIIAVFVASILFATSSKEDDLRRIEHINAVFAFIAVLNPLVASFPKSEG